MRLPPTPCRVCFRPCVFNKFSHFWQKSSPTGGAKRGEWELQSAPRKASGSGEAALAGSHSDLPLGGAPLPCARHFLWGTFLSYLQYIRCI